ncbi:MAG TPA: HAMP domain-containing sensor histidine kinase [Chitinophagaceae bacterium]|jgi:signal transduction histidine kinase|nr:HAMP domain-containing sensor histidine kinase [Chitinophagaceae bacterium]
MQNQIIVKKLFSSLYWRISSAFFLLLALVGLVYICITSYSSGIYFEQVNQRLNHNAAGDIAAHSSPFLNGKVNDKAMAELFHNIMAINPSLEVYLLDTGGKILSYYAPVKKIVLNRVNLTPIHEFIKSDGKKLVRGDDPRHPDLPKVFSAAPAISNGSLSGYIYVVLTGDEYDNAAHYLRSNYMLQVGSRAMLLTLFFAFGIGLVIIWLITKNLRKVIEVMQKFRKGDLNARITVQSTGDVKELSVIFNEMADILTQNVEKLKEVEVLRRELIANVSHDLRTPISIIHGYVETLEMKEKTISEEDRKRYLNTIFQSTQKLEKLVNELFELSKLEANQVRPQKEPFFISELVNDISSKYQLIAKEKNITLETTLSKEVYPVFADLSLIERVMQNLIDNALKFTPAGGRIVIQTSRKQEGIEVSVADSGIGIPDNEQEQVFERYYKGRDFTEYKTNTGLGLAIAKKIMDLHNSALILHSRVNEGSSFAFELPLYVTDERSRSLLNRYKKKEITEN